MLGRFSRYGFWLLWAQHCTKKTNLLNKARGFFYCVLNFTFSLGQTEHRKENSAVYTVLSRVSEIISHKTNETYLYDIKNQLYGELFAIFPLKVGHIVWHCPQFAHRKENNKYSERGGRVFSFLYVPLTSACSTCQREKV